MLYIVYLLNIIKYHIGQGGMYKNFSFCHENIDKNQDAAKKLLWKLDIYVISFLVLLAFLNLKKSFFF